MENTCKIIKVKRNKNMNKGKCGIYIFLTEESIIENLLTRHKKPYKLYKEQVIPTVIKMIKEQYDTDLSECEISWSQKAGCKCGCSPGFVIKGNNDKFDYYVDIEVK